MILGFEGYTYPWFMGILGILSVFIILVLPAINMWKKKHFGVIGNLLALVVYPIVAGLLLFLAAMILGIHH
jgi:predicted branched-subunit amino acid permease